MVREDLKKIIIYICWLNILKKEYHGEGRPVCPIYRMHGA